MIAIAWDRQRLARFKIVYQRAVDEQLNTFRFEGTEFIVAYARYLIENLDNLLEGPLI